ncbi:MAG TPA: hypothetical protein V6C97_14265 [Oculatellaceae cyanobacterium]
MKAEIKRKGKKTAASWLTWIVDNPRQLITQLCLEGLEEHNVERLKPIRGLRGEGRQNEVVLVCHLDGLQIDVCLAIVQPDDVFLLGKLELLDGFAKMTNNVSENEFLGASTWGHDTFSTRNGVLQMVVSPTSTFEDEDGRELNAGVRADPRKERNVPNTDEKGERENHKKIRKE